MKTVGIICEYNPFHRGHAKQFSVIREKMGTDCRIVCLMSGNYVQRGDVAVFDKLLRARAAADCGADLVLELPLTTALHSAEGFAAGGVRVLTVLGGVDALCFGCESGDADAIRNTAQVLCSEAFDPALRSCLQGGVSYAAAREQAARQLGADVRVLQRPNDILAVEYCKAIVHQNSPIQPLAIYRGGDYHAAEQDGENPSATSLRCAMAEALPWLNAVPEAAWPALDGACRHTLKAGEKAILARLRAMNEAEFAALPFGSEGLWRKLMHACHSQPTLEVIVEQTKSKRYARSRICRMLMCAYIGLTQQLLEQPAPYVRVLALNEAGGRFLRSAGQQAGLAVVNAGAPAPKGAYAELERRAEALYGLCAEDTDGWRCGCTKKDRVYFKK